MRVSPETAKRAALHFVHTSDMPSEHKVVILEVLRESLRNDQTAALNPDEERPWSADDEAEIRNFLGNKSARGWQHADELAMSLAARLRRTPSEVRRKAVEMGFGVSVDFALARWASRQNQT
jgi:hypothetical protein